MFNLQSGYLHPDEYFQGIEVAAGDIYNLDVLRTWEFRLGDEGPLRSVAGMSPFVHIPIQAAKWIHDLSPICHSFYLSPRCTVEKHGTTVK